MEIINWKIKKFVELSNDELYQILWLRSKVFVVEQNCVYLDNDFKDQQSFHFCGWSSDNSLLAYLRILPPGLSFKEASIGRVLVNPDYRGKGYGLEMMRLAIIQTLESFGVDAIKIGAQCYLIKFYESLGFAICSDEFLEDDIPHIEMIYKK
jgi:ElaA protein